MRRFLPLALFLVACSKPEETPKPVASAPKAPAEAPAEKPPGTPEEMAEEMDVPIYPGAEAPQDMSEVPAKRTDGGIGYSLVLATNDSVQKVGDWYAKELGQNAVASAKGMTVVGMTKKGNQAIIVVAPEAGRTLVRAKAIVYPKKG